ncbi:MAG: hypothetical protein ACREGF_00225, partial [Candidatus Saccharimonadales bacterium]
QDDSRQSIGLKIENIKNQDVRLSLAAGSNISCVSSMKIDSHGIVINKKSKQIIFNVNLSSCDETTSSGLNSQDIINIQSIHSGTYKIIAKLSENTGLAPKNANPYKTQMFSQTIKIQ